MNNKSRDTLLAIRHKYPSLISRLLGIQAFVIIPSFLLSLAPNGLSEILAQKGGLLMLAAAIGLPIYLFLMGLAVKLILNPSYLQIFHDGHLIWRPFGMDRIYKLDQGTQVDVNSDSVRFSKPAKPVPLVGQNSLKQIPLVKTLKLASKDVDRYLIGVRNT